MTEIKGQASTIAEYAKLEREKALSLHKERGTSGVSIEKMQEQLHKFVIAQAKNMNPLQGSDSDAVNNLYKTLVDLEQHKIQLRASQDLQKSIGSMNNIASKAQILGKSIHVASAKVPVSQDATEVTFKLDKTISSPAIEFYDGNDVVVHSSDLKPGQSSFTYYYKPDNSQQQAPDLRFRIIDKDSQTKIDVAQDKGFYSRAKEVIISESTDGEEQIQVLTESGDTVTLEALHRIKDIKEVNLEQAALLNVLSDLEQSLHSPKSDPIPASLPQLSRKNFGYSAT